jgi:hypothetical protein
MFVQSEDRDAVLEGFTIIGGFTESEQMGGGIFTYGSSPTIKNNILSGNYGYYGGGIGCYGGAPLIENNQIIDNDGERGGGMACFGGTQAIISGNYIGFNRSNGGWGACSGGGIRCENSYPAIIGNTIEENQSNYAGGGIGSFYGGGDISENTIINNRSVYAGGGIYLKFGQGSSIEKCLIYGNSTEFGGGVYIDHQAGVAVVNCTIADNEASMWAGGFFTTTFSFPTVENCIIYGNTGSEHRNVFVSGDDSAAVSYSDVEDGWEGTGNIDGNPLFADAVNGNYSLTWENYPVTDSTKSPCIDSGNPSALFLDPDNTRNDMGAVYFPQQNYVITDLTITIIGGGAVLQWGVIPGAVEYRIYASANPYNIAPILIGVILPPDTVFIDINAVSQGQKFYKVTAYW